MSEFSEQPYYSREDRRAEESHMERAHMEPGGSPRWVGLAVVALAAVSVLGVGVGWNATRQAQRAESALVRQTGQNQLVGQDLQALNQRLTQSEEVNTQLENQLVAVTDKLKMTQGEVVMARRQNGEIRDDYANKLTGVQSQLAAKASLEDLKSVGGDVDSVKGDLASTKNNLEMTRTEFSTLIARNHDEIDELRRMGERDYAEFTLTGKGNRSKVGDVMVELRGTNAKKKEFTVALYVDDLRLEKKNRAINEPIYFYMGGIRVPAELVVNQIGKDKIVGYMSVPKGQPRRAAAVRTAN